MIKGQIYIDQEQEPWSSSAIIQAIGIAGVGLNIAAGHSS